MTEELFRNKTITVQKDKLYGEVIITQPPSTYRITFIILLVVLAIVLLRVYGTYARRETVIGYVGYSSHVSFCRNFKKRFGCSPSNYYEVFLKNHATK